MKSPLRTLFPDIRVQKIAIDAGFSCPNRDGTISTGGCTFCNNATFNPAYCQPQKTVTQQLLEGKQFFSRKYPQMKYLAYFQAYSNTYAPLSRLQALYEEALRVPDVIGIVIATRPDCIDEEKLQYLEDLNRRTFLLIEYGVESCNDDTLRRINRGHTFQCSVDAITATHDRGIRTGAHLIFGLPGEDRDEIIRQAPMVNSLPIDILKIHQLQIIRGTQLAQQYLEKPFPLFTLDEYLHLIADYIPLLRKDILLDRFVSQSPKNLLIAPSWGIKNHEFTDKLQSLLK